MGILIYHLKIFILSVLLLFLVSFWSDFFFQFFNWRIIALQNFVVFCQQKSTWINHRYTYIPSLMNLPPISLPILPFQVDTEPLFEFPEPFSKFPLAIYFTYRNVSFHVTLSIHLTLSPLPMSISLFSMSVSPFSSVQLLSHVWLLVTPWIATHQASLSITNSRSSSKLLSIELVMPSSHLILCYPVFLLPPIPPRIRVFFNETTLHMRWPKY